ncbi:hypothetical protein SADUNF_Sadunf02G0182400 [Salix dunnii]|uniref:NEDD8-activating enzyme E1 regulatory subunit n=1 Tax=Salix dunnii TaxID=1413687 RepID=A0A835TK35_9ROSI|nr:hypothetical protein SADUNF_Sadunf02G0182400 [Salix dunnii]
MIGLQRAPYVVILVKMAEEWAKAHGGALPSTRDEKEEFKELLKAGMVTMDEDNYEEAITYSSKVFASQGISSDLLQLIHDSCSEVDSNSSDFWVMVAALKSVEMMLLGLHHDWIDKLLVDFRETEIGQICFSVQLESVRHVLLYEFIVNEGGGEAPLEGSIPDMASSTELYVNLQKIYLEKAEADFLVLQQRVKSILKRIGRDPDSISKAMIKSFCKNARKLKVCRYRLVEDEFSNPAASYLQKYLSDEEYSVAMGFYILLRAVDRFAANYNSFPGQFEGELDEDISRLKTVVVGLLNDLGCNGSTVTEDLINEMCRFGASELHAVAAFIGGIASQEVIKLITKQFVPMVGTFIFNGIDHKSQLLTL